MPVVTVRPCHSTSCGSPTLTDTIFINTLPKSHSSIGNHACVLVARHSQWSKRGCPDSAVRTGLMQSRYASRLEACHRRSNCTQVVNYFSLEEGGGGVRYAGLDGKTNWQGKENFPQSCAFAAFFLSAR